MVDIVACTSAKTLEPLVVSTALDMFRPPEKQHAALIDIAQDAANDPLCCVSVAQDGDALVGYASFHPPTEVETWG